MKKQQSPIVKISLIGLLALAIFQGLSYLKVINQYIVELPVEGRKTDVEEIVSDKEIENKKINALLVESKDRVKNNTEELGSLGLDLDSLFSLKKSVEDPQEKEPPIDLHNYFRKYVVVQAIQPPLRAVVNNVLYSKGDTITIPVKDVNLYYTLSNVYETKLELEPQSENGTKVFVYLK